MNIIKTLLNKIRGVQSLEKLKKQGLKVGSNVSIMNGCIIDPSHCWHIEIGNHVTLAPRVHILAHDASTKLFLNYTRIANVKIGNYCFIGAGTIILPGVTIGDHVVIGAGSVVTKDIPEDSLAVGVPAKKICSLKDYLEKENSKKNASNTFSEEYTIRNPKLSEKHKTELQESCKKFKQIFVE